MYDSDGDIRVKRGQKVTKLEITVRRSKGSQGDITVHWSLYHTDDSSESADLIWPSSGTVSMTDGQWSESFIVNVANNRKEVPESVVFVQLEDATGGALLASRDETTAMIVIASNMRNDHGALIITEVSVCDCTTNSFRCRECTKKEKKTVSIGYLRFAKPYKLTPNTLR